MIRRSGILFLLLMSGILICSGQNLFLRTYGFGVITEGKCVIETFDHGFAVCGSTTPGWGGQTNFYMLKTNGSGVPVFQYSYGGLGIDQSFAIIQLPDSGYLIAGYSNSFSANNDYDACLVRTDKSGNSIFTKTFGTSGWDFIYDMKQLPDGNFILIGNTYGSGTGNSAGYLIKVDTDGNVIWQKFIDNNQQVNLNHAAVKIDGTFAVCGNVSPSSSYAADYFIAMFDANGDTVFTKIIDGGKHEDANGIDFYSNGDIGIAGTSIDTINNDNNDETRIRLDATANNIIWSSIDLKPGNDGNNDLFIFNDSMYVSGSNSSVGAGNYDFKLQIFDGIGTYKDGKSFGFSENEFCYKAIRTSDLGLVLVGSTTSKGPGQTSVLLIKTDTVFTLANLVINTEEINTQNIFQVYPNPATDEINIISKSEEKINSVRVYSSTGQLVFELEKIIFPIKLDVSHFKSGFYFLETINEESIIREKILIVR